MDKNIETISKSGRIIEYIIDLIRNGSLQAGQSIPSINEISTKFGVARKTAVRAYDKLKSQGFIESRPQKGYFVINNKPTVKLKVLLIIHSFEGQWQTLYNVFREKVCTICDIDIYFHHYNIKLLELLINRNVNDYDYFIISSFNHPRIKTIVGRIPSHKVLIVSRNDSLDSSYNSVTQDFFTGTIDALEAAHKKISVYHRLTLSYPEKKGHSDELKRGFSYYAEKNRIASQIVNALSEIEIKQGEAYLVIEDDDLIHLLTVCKNRNWQLGKDVGVIAYNETPIKQVIRDGISVISCDFAAMAETMADYILKKIAIKTIIPIQFIERNSL